MPTRTPTPATITGSNRPLVICGTWLDVAPDSTPKYSPTAADTGIGTGTKTMKSTDSAREKSRLRGKPRSTRKLPLVYTSMSMIGRVIVASPASIVRTASGSFNSVWKTPMLSLILR